MDIDELFKSVKQRLCLHMNLKDHQKTLIKAVLEKKDAVGLLPTGYGKSMCYTLPPLMLDEASHKYLSLVVSPLLSLMKDQQRELGSLGIQSVIASHDSKIDIKDTQDSSVILTTPETLQTSWFRKLLRGIKHRICLLACDEAHCVSEWGEAFRPEYRHISSIRSIVDAPMMALTATCTQKVQDDIIESLLMQDALVIAMIPDRPNIFLSATRCSQDCETELVWLMEKIKVTQSDCPKTIIFCRSYTTVYNVWSYLYDNVDKGTSDNRTIEMFHSSTDVDSKERILTEFQSSTSEVRVLVATVAFGMGVSIPDIRLIVHWGAAKNIISYWQEVGRAGRDGTQALAFMYAFPRSLVKGVTDIEMKELTAMDKCLRSTVLIALKTDAMKEDVKSSSVCVNNDCRVCFCTACVCCSVCWAACQCKGKEDKKKLVF